MQHELLDISPPHILSIEKQVTTERNKDNFSPSSEDSKLQLSESEKEGRGASSEGGAQSTTSSGSLSKSIGAVKLTKISLGNYPIKNGALKHDVSPQLNSTLTHILVDLNDNARNLQR